MKLSSMFTAILLTALVVTGIGIFQSEIAASYGTNTTDMSYLNKTTDVLVQTEHMQEEIGSEDINPLAFVMSSAWRVLQYLFNLGDIMSSMVADISDMLQLPGFVGWIIMAILSALILFAVLKGILKVDI